MSALGMATLGVQCTDKALGMSSLGLFCDELPPIQPPTGGGGSGPGIGLPGENYYNQAPPRIKDPNKYEQALQEDEEMLMIFKSIIELIEWH